MSSASHRSDVEYSRGDRAERHPSRGLSAARGALALCGIAGIAGLIAATLSPIRRIEVAGHVVAGLRPDRLGPSADRRCCCVAAVALVLLVARPARVARGRARRRRLRPRRDRDRLLGDLPDIGDHGLVGERLVQGTVTAGAGAFAEVLGGVLLLLAGGVLASLDRD